MCALLSDDVAAWHRNDSIMVKCGFLLFVLRYIGAHSGYIRLIWVHLECVNNLGVVICDSDVWDLGKGICKEFLDVFVQGPGSGVVFNLIVDLFSFSAFLAYLAMLEPVNELFRAMLAVFIF